MFEYVIFAFDTEYQNDGTDIAIMDGAASLFPGHIVKRCAGIWEETAERSWWTTRPVYDEVMKHHSGLLTNQICILCVPQDGKNKPYLEYADGRVETLDGFFKEFSFYDRHKFKAYTFDVAARKYYGVY